MEDQDSTRLCFLYNHLRSESIRCLEEYITNGRGTLRQLKDHFLGLLSEEDLRVRNVRKLVEALEAGGRIGHNNVELLKMLAEKLNIPELKEKVEEFEKDCSGMFQRTLNAAGRAPGFIWNTFKGGVCTSAIHLKTVLSVGGVVGLAGAALMYLCGMTPEKLNDLQPFVEFGARVVTILKGSVVFVLKVSSISSLKQLWQSYKDGSFKEKLKIAFNEMKKLKELSQGEEIDVDVTIDEEEYREVLWNLILSEVKGDSKKTTKRQRRHSVCCGRDVPDDSSKPVDVTRIQIRIGQPVAELEKSINHIERFKREIEFDKKHEWSRIPRLDDEVHRLSEIQRQLSKMEISLAASCFSRITIREVEKTHLTKEDEIVGIHEESKSESLWSDTGIQCGSHFSTEQRGKFKYSGMAKMKEIFRLPEPRNEDIITQIIGEDGKNLREMENKTGIKRSYIRMKRNKNEVHIIGTEKQVNEAKILLQDLIDKELERQKFTLKVQLPTHKIGLVMGKGGKTVKDIEKRTSTSINVKNKCAYIRGQVKANREQAASEIRELLVNELRSPTTDGKIKINVPPGCKLGPVIGKGFSNLTKIKEKTGASVDVINNELYVSGNDKECKEAIIELKSKMAEVCNKMPVPEQFNFLHATEQSADYKLQAFDCPNPFWNGEKHFKVCTMDTEEAVLHPSEDLNTEELQEFLYKVLKEVQQEIKGQGVKADFFCHFGHLYIGNVDEGDQEKHYNLNDLKAEFKKNKKESWRLRFNPAIEELEFKELENTLQEYSEGSCTVDPHVRHDFQFYTPNCTSVRAKVFMDMDGNTDLSFSHQDIDIRKHDPQEVSSTFPAPKYMLCDPFLTRARVNILVLSGGLDCRLAIRTVSTPDDPNDKTKEFEESITKYLDKITIENKKVCMPADTEMPDNPGDYCLYYWRKCQRRSYPYKADGEDFSVTISEEDIMDVTGSGQKESTKTDIHLHCDEWDRLLTSGTWEPEQIVEKLPQFLKFVRDVQSNISGPQK